MTFHAWWHWLVALPWSRRWFVLLVAIRPIVDALYFLKEVSPLLSPLYFIGVMTPVVVAFLMAMRWLPKPMFVHQDYVFAVLMLTVLLNCLFVLGIEVSLVTVEVVLKVTIPFVIYFFARSFIRSGDDLFGVVTTFVFSSIVPFSLLFYETVFEPFGSSDVTRGMERLEGLYADAVSYAVYSTQAFLCLLYMFLARFRFSTKGIGTATRDITIGFVMCLICLLAIKHAASWAVCFALLGLVVFSSGQRGGFVLVLGLGLMVGVAFFMIGDRIKQDTAALYKTDVAVVHGDLNVERGLHGRVSIWKRLMSDWQRFPTVAKLFGSPMSLNPKARLMLLGSVHSDYLRMTFLAGLWGLLLYCGFLAMNFLTSFKAANPEKFLIRGMLILYGMYSITMMPSLYAPCIYLGMSIFAYAALVEEVSMKTRQTENW